MTGKALLVMCFYLMKELCPGPLKKQPVIALSTIEAEFVAVVTCACVTQCFSSTTPSLVKSCKK